MDPLHRSNSERRPSTPSVVPTPGSPQESKPAPHPSTIFPRLASSAAPAVGSSTHQAPPAALRALLVPLRSRGHGGSSQPPPSVFYAHPPNMTGRPADGGPRSPSPTAATAESMELAVVPFVRGSHDPGSVHRSPHSNHANAAAGANGDETGDGSDNNGGFYPPAAAAAYGELAPTALSTERVCPNCLRPYGFYGEDPYADMYDPADALYRSGDSAASQTRQLPPPRALTAPNTPQQDEQQSQQQQQRSPFFLSSSAPNAAAFAKALAAGPGGVGGEAGGTPSKAPHIRNPALVHSSSNGGSGEPVFPPPAVAFTTHYFRALPPPAVITAAVAAGTAPLAIEDFHDPDARGDNEEEGGPPLYAAVLAGGQPGRSLSGHSGALVPARPTPSRRLRGSPSTRKGPSSPLKLMQSGEDEANEQISLPDDTEREAPLRLDDDEEEKDSDGSPPSAYSSNAPGPEPNNGYYKHYFKELRQLGRGTYGGVYLCCHLMCGVNLGVFALKKIPVGDKAGYLQSVLREVRILEEVRRHPNVVEYKHSWVEDAQLADFGPPVRCLFILMEYASAGSLDAYLEKYGTHLSTLAVWYFFLSAVAGTAHLHRKHILHRDLKPQNLLLAETKGRPPRVLVSDFGTAAILDDISYERSGGTGTLEYMAPELFEVAASPRGVNEHYVNHHTVFSDVWSLGIILYYLAFDATLPDRRNDGSVILGTPRQASYGRPPEMMKLIEAMLQLDPAKRPRCSDILGSSFVQSILRMFNQDDLTQWDLLAQQQERTRRESAVKSPSSPQDALAMSDSSPLGNGLVGENQNSAHASHNRPRIAVTSTTAAALRLHPGRPTAGNDSTNPDNANLFSSRVVELQSTTALIDLVSTRPASGTITGDEPQPLQQPPSPSYGRGRPARRLSLTRERRETRPLSHSGISRGLRSSTTGSIMSPPASSPTRRVDEGVQTDPVKIVDA
ncbi:putative Protein kinase [Leptomonas pyrrhocoris]|uniref:non-specific serine/threonine protein kinase n=1 Tax=Leptomonas pyrrhocoris TaxID=157538 RepID=A0A0M9G0F1_LEPPY|nr:putative Protein kinase [Leptomonas pyrrhocoris]KPA79637.1 putative Protein kinase [Leptomonas pyrrhocoris]|eukprot:XP_015658076.1 putative Protein kinase [Leptomonas pyrrhocoris]